MSDEAKVTDYGVKALQHTVETRVDDASGAQKTATAIIAVNAIANIPGLRPAPSMLERAMAPSDEEFEEDPEGVMALWGGICERAYERYRTRGPKKK